MLYSYLACLQNCDIWELGMLECFWLAVVTFSEIQIITNQDNLVVSEWFVKSSRLTKLKFSAILHGHGIVVV
jgi:hypothetical protein